MPTSGRGRLEIDDREELATSAHLKQTPKHFWPVETRAHERAAEGGSRNGGHESVQGEGRGRGGGGALFAIENAQDVCRVTGGESKRGGVGA